MVMQVFRFAERSKGPAKLKSWISLTFNYPARTIQDILCNLEAITLVECIVAEVGEVPQRSPSRHCDRLPTLETRGAAPIYDGSGKRGLRVHPNV